MPLGKEVVFGPGHIVLGGDPAPTAAPPHFRPMLIVTKRSPISAAVELLLIICNTLMHIQLGHFLHNLTQPSLWLLRRLQM